MNIGKKWSIEEETRLLDELASGMTILEISNLHGRTSGAISSRQRHMAANFYSDGMSVKEIMERCRMTQHGLIVTLRNRGLDVLKIKNSFLPNKMDRLAKVNEALKYAEGIPQNKWDYGKYREMYENNLKEALKRLEDHKTKISEMENKCRLRGVEETEIQKEVYRSFSHMHIQLLEQVISAKKALAMMDMGSVEELTRQRIAILEEMAND